MKANFLIITMSIIASLFISCGSSDSGENTTNGSGILLKGSLKNLDTKSRAKGMNFRGPENLLDIDLILAKDGRGNIKVGEIKEDNTFSIEVEEKSNQLIGFYDKNLELVAHIGDGEESIIPLINIKSGKTIDLGELSNDGMNMVPQEDRAKTYSLSDEQLKKIKENDSLFLLKSTVDVNQNAIIDTAEDYTSSLTFENLYSKQMYAIPYENAAKANDGFVYATATLPLNGLTNTKVTNYRLTLNSNNEYYVESGGSGILNYFNNINNTDDTNINYGGGIYEIVEGTGNFSLNTSGKQDTLSVLFGYYYVDYITPFYTDTLLSLPGKYSFEIDKGVHTFKNVPSIESKDYKDLFHPEVTFKYIFEYGTARIYDVEYKIKKYDSASGSFVDVTEKEIENFPIYDLRVVVSTTDDWNEDWWGEYDESLWDKTTFFLEKVDTGRGTVTEQLHDVVLNHTNVTNIEVTYKNFAGLGTSISYGF